MRNHHYFPPVAAASTKRRVIINEMGRYSDQDLEATLRYCNKSDYSNGGGWNSSGETAAVLSSPGRAATMAAMPPQASNLHSKPKLTPSLAFQRLTFLANETLQLQQILGRTGLWPVSFGGLEICAIETSSNDPPDALEFPWELLGSPSQLSGSGSDEISAQSGAGSMPRSSSSNPMDQQLALHDQKFQAALQEIRRQAGAEGAGSRRRATRQHRSRRKSRHQHLSPSPSGTGSACWHEMARQRVGLVARHLPAALRFFDELEAYTKRFQFERLHTIEKQHSIDRQINQYLLSQPASSARSSSTKSGRRQNGSPGGSWWWLGHLVPRKEVSSGLRRSQATAAAARAGVEGGATREKPLTLLLRAVKLLLNLESILYNDVVALYMRHLLASAAGGLDVSGEDVAAIESGFIELGRLLTFFRQLLERKRREEAAATGESELRERGTAAKRDSSIGRSSAGRCSNSSTSNSAPKKPGARQPESEADAEDEGGCSAGYDDDTLVATVWKGIHLVAQLDAIRVVLWVLGEGRARLVDAVLLPWRELARSLHLVDDSGILLVVCNIYCLFQNPPTHWPPGALCTFPQALAELLTELGENSAAECDWSGAEPAASLLSELETAMRNTYQFALDLTPFRLSPSLPASASSLESYLEPATKTNVATSHQSHANPPPGSFGLQSIGLTPSTLALPYKQYGSAASAATNSSSRADASPLAQQLFAELPASSEHPGGADKQSAGAEKFDDSTTRYETTSTDGEPPPPAGGLNLTCEFHENLLTGDERSPAGASRDDDDGDSAAASDLGLVTGRPQPEAAAVLRPTGFAGKTDEPHLGHRKGRGGAAVGASTPVLAGGAAVDVPRPPQLYASSPVPAGAYGAAARSAYSFEHPLRAAPVHVPALPTLIPNDGGGVYEGGGSSTGGSCNSLSQLHAAAAVLLNSRRTPRRSRSLARVLSGSCSTSGSGSEAACEPYGPYLTLAKLKELTQALHRCLSTAAARSTPRDVSDADLPVDSAVADLKTALRQFDKREPFIEALDAAQLRGPWVVQYACLLLVRRLIMHHVEELTAMGVMEEPVGGRGAASTSSSTRATSYLGGLIDEVSVSISSSHSAVSRLALRIAADCFAPQNRGCSELIALVTRRCYARTLKRTTAASHSATRSRSSAAAVASAAIASLDLMSRYGDTHWLYSAVVACVAMTENSSTMRYHLLNSTSVLIERLQDDLFNRSDKFAELINFVLKELKDSSKTNRQLAARVGDAITTLRRRRAERLSARRLEPCAEERELTPPRQRFDGENGDSGDDGHGDDKNNT